ncbi:GNAT family N-acetyltransferase [Vibrio astriarenae]|uniref:GNAT family N-acetyltransferase n=1 Tax=Vibrio astriarenae TaxID=1481923 RepID=A0A7Z2YD65_9VIBR|nr:GNAT family N-acetyltransferase [Vibrio astriarenae]QIA63048.1 GNAT family N-acetyltransferase [Vibrio astriarenae]
MIQLDDYRSEDANDLWSIYFHTIRHINIRDYSLDQVAAWAPDNIDPQRWRNKMESIKPFIAKIDGKPVGYADLQQDGLIYHFFCHHQFQSRGVGRALMTHIEQQAKQRGTSRLYSHVSITARPFYERMGFTVVKEQLIEVRQQHLKNFVMEKPL